VQWINGNLRYYRQVLYKAPKLLKCQLAESPVPNNATKL
jgi:hypothetical protein